MFLYPEKKEQIGIKTKTLLRLKSEVIYFSVSFLSTSSHKNKIGKYSMSLNMSEEVDVSIKANIEIYLSSNCHNVFVLYFFCFYFCLNMLAHTNTYLKTMVLM